MSNRTNRLASDRVPPGGHRSSESVMSTASNAILLMPGRKLRIGIRIGCLRKISPREVIRIVELMRSLTYRSIWLPGRTAEV